MGFDCLNQAHGLENNICTLIFVKSYKIFAMQILKIIERWEAQKEKLIIL